MKATHSIMRIEHLPCFLVLVLSLAACGSSGGGECAAGASGCPCGPASQCEGDLVCDTAQNVCESSRTISLPAIDSAARSCELLLEDDGASVVGADFAPSVRGETVRQSPRTAVAFYGTADAPIRSSAVRIKVVGSGGMTIARARCFDRDGQPLPGGGISTGS